MPFVESDLGSLSDVDIQDQIRDLELQIARCAGQLESEDAEIKRSLRLARGTFLTAGGFFGLALDPISAVLAVVGFFDWMEAVRDDAAQENLSIEVRRQLAALRPQLAMLEMEVQRRTAKGGP